MSQDSQKDVQKQLQEIVANIPGARLMMSGGGRIFLSGYQKNTDCRYSLSLRVDTDQSLVAFSEEFNYLPREDDDGMVYVYALTIPGEQQEGLLKLLLEKCQLAQIPEASSLPELLLKLLTLLGEQGHLTLPQTGKRNLYMLAEWLQAAHIPHTGPYLAF